MIDLFMTFVSLFNFDIIIRQVQLMKNYSFSSSQDEETYPTRKSTDLSSCYRHSELRAKEANQRIEEIKKKYDTPSRRQRIDSLKKSQQFGVQNRTPAQDDSKENASSHKDYSAQSFQKYGHQPVPTFGGNPLKQSYAVNRLEKSALKNDVDSRQLDNLRRIDRSPLQEKGMNLYERKPHTREDQEALFTKVREMKESLISQDIMKSSINGRSSGGSFKYNQVNESKADNSRQFDPRVQNIDKINSKIKQILSCLTQNNKHPSKYMRQSSNASYVKDQVRSSTLNSQIFRQNKEDTRSSYVHSEVQKSNKIFAPISSIPSEKSKPIEESNVYNFYKHNDSKNEHFESKYSQECKTVPNEDTYNKKYKVSGESFGYDESRSQCRESRNYSASRGETYSSKIFKKAQEYARTPTCVQTKQFDVKTGIKGQRSRSYMGTISKSALTDNDKDVLRSGKKLTEEISRIQSRIQEMEKQKTKLNITFTPFTMKNRSASVLGTFHNSSIDSNKKVQKPHIPHFRSSSTTKQRQMTAHFGNYRDKDNQVSGSLIKNSSTDGHTRSVHDNFQLSLEKIDVDVKTLRIDQPEDLNQEVSINKNDDYQLPIMNKEVSFGFDEVKKRTDDGILDRKRRLQHQELIKTDSLKKLVILFCQQAKLDEQLRNHKFWLQEYHKQDKFQQLASAISQKGLTMNSDICSKIFKVEESQHNPFFTVQGFDGSIQAVAYAYLQAYNHWTNQIKHMFHKQSLLAEGFTKNKIDLERKGYIELQDLVRLLNIESGTFYRNRDIFLIFRRLTPSDRTSFEEILQQISA